MVESKKTNIIELKNSGSAKKKSNQTSQLSDTIKPLVKAKDKDLITYLTILFKDD